MKRLHRVMTSLLLSLAMVLGMGQFTLPVLAGEESETDDGNGVTTDAASLNWDVDLGLADDQQMKRLDICTYIWTVMEKPEPQQTSMYYSDVNTSMNNWKAVNWCKEQGILIGKTATEFAPSDIVTRAQASAIMYNAFGNANLPNVVDSVPRFVDVSSEKYYYETASWAVQKGLMNTDTETAFAPQMALQYGMLKKKGSAASDRIELSDAVYGIMHEDGLLEIVNKEINAQAIPDDAYAKLSDKTINKVVIREGIDGIGASAFKNHTELTSVSLPNSLKSIGTEAFFGCTSLTGVTFNGGKNHFETGVTIADDNDAIKDAARNDAFYLKNEYTLTFDLDGGTGTDSEIAEENSLWNEPDDPVKAGYTFNGWYTEDGKTFEFLSAHSNMTVKAEWTRVSSGSSSTGGSSSSGTGSNSSSPENTVTASDAKSTEPTQLKSEGVTLLDAGKVLEEGTSFTAETVAGGTVYEQVKESIQESFGDPGQDAVLELTLKKNGVEIHELGGFISITLPIPKGISVKNGKTLRVYRCEDNGSGKYTMIPCETSVADGKVTFRTNHFSIYVIREEDAFTDISKDDYFYDAVLWAVEKGVTSGTSATTFSPADPCTRAQIVTFLWKAAGAPDAAITNKFTDLPDNKEFQKAISWAVANSITAGTTDTTFSPSDLCTRAQIMTFLYKAAKVSYTATKMPFTDVVESKYYAAPIAWAYANKVTSGTSATTFGVNDTCTRGQSVTFLYNALK